MKSSPNQALYLASSSLNLNLNLNLNLATRLTFHTRLIAPSYLAVVKYNHSLTNPTLNIQIQTATPCHSAHTLHCKLPRVFKVARVCIKHATTVTCAARKYATPLLREPDCTLVLYHLVVCASSFGFAHFLIARVPANVRPSQCHDVLDLAQYN